MTHWSIAALLALMVAGGASTHAEDASPGVDARPALPWPHGVEAQDICGHSTDFQDVETYDGSYAVSKSFVAAHEASTVQLQWRDTAAITAQLPGYTPGNVAGERWCSGTLIAGNLVLTAGHCLDVQNGRFGWTSPFTYVADGAQQYAAPDVLAKLQVVNIRYQVNGATGALRRPDVFPIARLVEHRNGGLDYAIVELGPNTVGKQATDLYPAAQVATREALPLELVGVVQHPDGLPKKVAAGHVWRAAGTNVYYDDIDTLGGSSGSAVRDADGKVLAVHTNGGCTSTAGANRGVATAAIAKVSKAL